MEALVVLDSARGVTAIGVTAIVLAQDAEPSTVLVGVTW